MSQIGLYEQTTQFTNKDAGTSVWCKAQKNGKTFFVKKMLSPVRPANAADLPAEKYRMRVQRFEQALAAKRSMYQAIADADKSGVITIPCEIIEYQNHICAISEFVAGNVKPEQVCQLTDWQKIVILRTLTMAVWNLHRANVVHSDMKPSNILFTQMPDNPACIMKLIDFDSSFIKSAPPKTSEEVCGDLAYFAPEVLRQSCGEFVTLDERVDIFAMGLVFHYLWTGKLPSRSSTNTISECLLSGESIELDLSIPLAIRKTIERMIDVQPENRLTCPVIYEILGIQLKKFPKRSKYLAL